MSTSAGPLERRWRELAPLFDHAFELDEVARAAYVDSIPDAELRAALHTLLAGTGRDSPIDAGSGRYAAELVGSGLEGRRIGAWRIGRAVGAGGMATVFSARREDGAYEQQVAIKILRHGLYDPYERERFVRERAILARLEHPHVARLLDGGFTAEGVPWFALEYVDGAPVTDWCDARQLGLAARLALFGDICATVAYAQRNLVVHRDLKPSNILIDRDGNLKLLDFGIARLLDDAADDAATRTEARRLTPAYAAPEQGNGGAVTTATDVYALGVLLHELCSGQRPQRRDDGSLRAPSAAVETTAAHQRACDARSLRRRLDGELGLVIAKALRTDPAERYANAAELGDDMRRLADGKPISARPDSRAYRFAKFARRHRVGLALGAAFALAVLGGTAATAWQARVARTQAVRADAVRGFLLALFDGITPDESKGRVVSARELVDRGAARLGEALARAPGTEAPLATALAGAYRQVGDYGQAATFAQRAVAAADDAASRSEALVERGRTQAATGDYDGAERDLREALAEAPSATRGAVRLRLGDVLAERGKLDEAATIAADALAGARDDDERGRALAAIGGLHFRQGRLDEAARELAQALALSRAVHGERHTLTATDEHDLGVVVLQQGDARAAAALFEQALATRRALLGEHPDVADSEFNLGAAARRSGDPERAARLVGDALAMQRRLLGANHPAVARSLNSLALLANERGDTSGAITLMGDALEVARTAYGPTHATVATMQNNLAGMQRAAGRYVDAEASARAAIATTIAAVGADHYLVGVARLGLGGVLADRGDGAAAIVELRAAHDLLATKLGADHQDTLLAGAALASALREAGRVDEARPLADATLAAAEKAFPAGHPRLGRIRLAALLAAADGGDCERTRSLDAATTADLDRLGAAGRIDRAWLALARARCRTGADGGADPLAEAHARLAELPFTPPALALAGRRLDH